VTSSDDSGEASRRPLVSVIMANYNGAVYLADAIASVRKQSLRDIELIVSDDASTDDSVGIVEAAVAADPRIRLIRHQSNGGPSAARNRALAVARGEWIAVMDSDDLMHEDRLTSLVEAAQRDGADFVADNLVEFDTDISRPSGYLLTGEWENNPFWVDINDYVRLNQFYGPGPALGYLKPIFRASLFFDPSVRYDETLRNSEDFNLVLQLMQSGKTLRVYPMPLYYYRKHGESTSHRLNEKALIALKQATLQFFDQVGASDRFLSEAIRARLRSIETALAYEKLLASLKGRNLLRALSIAISRPQAAALLRLPIGVRLKRGLAGASRKKICV
jgi:glycosyltransferase involved in cell wall biosynthesis